MKLSHSSIFQVICRKAGFGLLLSRLVLLSITFLFTTSVMAQARVVDLGSGSSRQSNTSSSGTENNKNDIVLNLYFQLETLQQELQTLRGIVEEQSYQIRRMETQSRDRYLDIDSRLSGLSNSPGSGSDAPVSVRGMVTGPGQTPLTSRAGEATTGRGNDFVNEAGVNGAGAIAADSLPMPQNEQELYRTALNLLVEDSNYEDSVSMFQQYIDVYPNGRYAANAYYWQGEALILMDRYDQARAVFNMVIKNHPGHAKAPGAMMKLVVTYIQVGDSRQAKQVLQDLRTQYPDDLAAISAAEDYLSKAGI